MSRRQTPREMGPGPMVGHLEPLLVGNGRSASAGRGNRPKIGPAQWERIFARDGGSCCDCGSTSDLTADHICPWSKGGSSRDVNLRLLCNPCNELRAATGPAPPQRGPRRRRRVRASL